MQYLENSVVINEKIIKEQNFYEQKTKKKVYFLLVFEKKVKVKTFSIPYTKFLKTLQGTFPENIRYLSLKASEEIDFK